VISVIARQVVAVLLVSVSSVALAAGPSGEHLVYTVGCVNCHHQTPKDIINAPPLVIVKSYSLPEFRRLMKSGVTRTGRDMLAQSSIMGIVATEQFSHFTDDEVKAIYEFLSRDWTVDRGLVEEKKIPRLYRPGVEKAAGHP
jgi:cytochrome c5